MADQRSTADGLPGRYMMREQVVERALHSWARVDSAGHTVLIQALQIFNPMSKDLSDTEELVSFLQGLREEGHKPTVLRSKDVYGYKSCMTRPLSLDTYKPSERLQRPAKKKGRKSLAKKSKQHPSWSLADRSQPRIHWPESSPVPGSVPKPPPVHVMMQPCLRLTNIEGLSGCHTARLQFQTDWDSERTRGTNPTHPHPPSLSGIPVQPQQNGGGAQTAVALLSQRSGSCPGKVDGALIGDSAPVLCSNGGVFTESSMELTSSGAGRRGNRYPLPRRCTRENQDASPPQPTWLVNGQRNGWHDKNSLRWVTVKVDDSRSVEEARRKAQMILQVNLSPVIQIQPK
ncbi:uncharacterized protein ccdc71 [Aplochiton taeniatus]